MENENQFKSKNVKTYTDEMVKVIENDKSGLIKKIIHEEERHEIEKKNISPKSKKNRVFMFVSILLVVLSLGMLVFLLFFKEKINIISVAPSFTPIIFNDKTDFVPVDGLKKEEIMKLVSTKINNTKVKTGGVEGFYLTENKKSIQLSRFISLMKGNLDLSKSGFFSENFLLGVFRNDGSVISSNVENPFILLKIKSFTDVFPVMRSWEQKMLYDLYGFFNVKISAEENYLFTKNFEDGIVQNKNARILKDNDGKVVLMYVFLDDSFVLVTNSEFATNEVISRLASTKIRK